LRDAGHGFARRGSERHPQPELRPLDDEEDDARDPLQHLRAGRPRHPITTAEARRAAMLSSCRNQPGPGFATNSLPVARKVGSLPTNAPPRASRAPQAQKAVPPAPTERESVAKPPVPPRR